MVLHEGYKYIIFFIFLCDLPNETNVNVVQLLNFPLGQEQHFLVPEVNLFIQNLLISRRQSTAKQLDR